MREPSCTSHQRVISHRSAAAAESELLKLSLARHLHILQETITLSKERLRRKPAAVSCLTRDGEGPALITVFHLHLSLSPTHPLSFTALSCVDRQR
ncbi:Uncharacterized protein DAT39_017452 [Clarias magur]|uniref:Uncharacterized protein n=1 Tax=Clarias magur TaxID=1594786 RepID=A0A8J4WW48_CLAMG|nr:Uncharacterized protein DAT39_017452 [Clarias magur]